jgi:DNA polymerase I-like protein with 3'-5' exonuclease and polymerase domains
VLNWPLPVSVVDLCVEYKLLRNGHGWGRGRGLLAALLGHGIDVAAFTDKKEMQLLAAKGGPYTAGQRESLLAYNQQDVRALEKLLPAMLPRLDFPRCLLRGRYMVEVAKIEDNGIPVNREELQALGDNWDALKDAFIAEVDQNWNVWEGRTFKLRRWKEVIRRRGWDWPRREDGEPSLERKVFKQMAERYPEIKPVYELRSLLSQLKHFELPVGLDERARCSSFTFGTITGRNAPEARDFVFAWPGCFRGLVQAPPGRALVNLDYAQQEYLISGVLSRDRQMIEDYKQGDVYVALGKSLGLIPPDGDQDTHEKERDLCKVIVLACTYGMGAEALAEKIGRPVTVAADFLRRHRENYARFWQWSDATVDFARAHRWLRTRYGWSAWIAPGSKETTWRNWRVQATGGEVLRVAVCALGAAGFRIAATVHDSVLLEADAAVAEGAAKEAQRLMVAASVAVLGEPLRVDPRIVPPGGRLLGRKAAQTWDRIWGLMARLQAPVTAQLAS